jgi:hypothetical protein
MNDASFVTAGNGMAGAGVDYTRTKATDLAAPAKGQTGSGGRPDRPAHRG